MNKYENQQPDPTKFPRYCGISSFARLKQLNNDRIFNGYKADVIEGGFPCQAFSSIDLYLVFFDLRIL